MATYTISAAFKAINNVSAPFKQMQADVNKFGSSAQASAAKASTGFTRIGAGIKNVASNIIGGGLAIGAGFIVRDAVMQVVEYEQATANLAGVMGKTVEQNKALSADALRLGAVTAKSATEVIGLQEAYARLGFEQQDILNLTEATINGSIALRGGLSETAELTGAVVKTFEALGTNDAPAILDKMTVATQKSALNFEKLQTALPIVGGAANAAGISFDRTLALLGKLSDAGIDASSSATSLRNIFLESAKKGLTYDQILKKIVSEQDSLTAANDEFGKRAAVSGVILAKNIAATDELATTLGKASAGGELAGAAFETSQKQLDTLGGRATLFSSAWSGLILSVENGNGSFGKFAKTTIEVTTQILNILSGAAALSKPLTEQQILIDKIARAVLFAVKAFLIYKAVMIAFTAVQWAWSTVQAVNLALQGKTLLFLTGNKVAMAAYLVISKAVILAQWAWNAAMTANPIGLIIMGVAALIALVSVAIYKWDEWGAALLFFLGPIGFIINAIMILRKQWDSVTQAFSSGGILAGLKRIAVVLLDTILYPMQQLLELISKVPVIGGYAADGAAKINDLRQSLELTNPNTEKEKARVERNETFNQNTLEVLINNKSNGQADVSSAGDLAPKFTPTFNFNQ